MYVCSESEEDEEEHEFDHDALALRSVDDVINPYTNEGTYAGDENCTHEIVRFEGLCVFTTSGEPFHTLGETFRVRNDQTGRFLGMATVIGIHDVKNKIKLGTVPNEELDHFVYK